MTQTRRYLLHPRGVFHFGERGIGGEETAELLHSDTLLAAVISAWRVLGDLGEPADTPPDILAPFTPEARRPPLRVSSALPFAGPVQLFPRPLLPLGIEKALKDVQYVSAGALGLIGQGAQLTRERAGRELIQSGKVWVLPEEQARIAELLLAEAPDADELRARWERDPALMKIWWAGDELIPRVAVDRVSATANLFHTGRLRFANGCGLAFWAEADVGGGFDYLELLEQALDVLADEGLGGKRSVGYGQFRWEGRDEAPEDALRQVTLGADAAEAAPEPNGFLTLSLYLPDASEYTLLPRAWYRRILRRGWIFSPEGRNLRRRGVWMLREGSVLPAAPLGTLEDVRPEVGHAHPVWRNGYALSLALRFANLAS